MSDDNNAARKEAAIELGKGIALGLVPVLGQAIDVYDTIESAIAMHQAAQGEPKDAAQFDFVLALVGWIPGPGDGIKKSLRIVNRDPDRYAPVLFDLLRFVLNECGMRTSPEALLDEVFNAGKLRAQIVEIERGVLQSSTFEALPGLMQDVVRGGLTTAQQSMPALVGTVQRRLTRWKRVQRNSSARETTGPRDGQALPQARDGATASGGESRASVGHANTATHGTLAQQALTNVTNEMAGISGEHIADYICVERFKWGQWSRHDEGAQGRFAAKPDAREPGKLSKGGSPKSTHKLYRLEDGANGTGIDAVWRAEGHNGGKPYAIVEAKATRDEDAPKFMRRINNTRKPAIASKLGVNAIGDASELLEPLEDDGAGTSAPANRSNRRAGAQRGAANSQGAGSTPAAASSPSPSARGRVAEVLVQMSEEWIELNTPKAIGASAAIDVLRKLPGDARNYSRHLFFSPAYHPSGSPKAHMQAKVMKQSDSTVHAHHDAFHYEEAEVMRAVNKRKTLLRKKYGDLPSLGNER